ncbi:MAG: ChbG/HpnK family deacetylase [Clostridiales bacterium]|jgi:predicted glycoside hydrolase/deacetylase ChbG (UPF0249 family)|nr:ChbG/HpnK family deacetylase [Clostridiales bacterium]
MRKRLIINADDFGITPETNKAVERLFKQGAITQASLLAVSSYAEEAAEIARRLKMPVSAHLTIVSEWAEFPWKSAAPPETVPSILDGSNCLRASATEQLKKAVPAEAMAELKAQIGLARSLVGSISSADSHGQFLYSAAYLPKALALCSKERLAFRIPSSYGFYARQMGVLPLSFKALVKAVSALSCILRVPAPRDCITDPRSVAKIKGYEDLRLYYLKTLKESKAGLVEMFLHPCLPGGSQSSPEWEKRLWEFRLLDEGVIQETAKKLGFELSSWSKELARNEASR